jgi:hypothetical protein
MQSGNPTEVKHLPSGYTDLLDIKKDDLLSIDKTRFIIDLHEMRKENQNAKMLFISRPSGFGKTSITSMLSYFYSRKHDFTDSKDSRWIFNDCIIHQHQELMNEYHGKFTVINFDLATFYFAENCQELIVQLQHMLCRLYDAFEKSVELSTKDDQDYFTNILEKKTSNPRDLEMALAKLCQFICAYNKKQNRYEKPIIIIDEFDTPLHSAELKGFFLDAFRIIKNILRNLAEAPESFEMAIMTGILPQAEHLPSLKNISVHNTLQDDLFSDAYAFTEDEVKHAMSMNHLDTENKYENVLKEYGHYYCGNQMLFRPRSVVNALRKDREINFKHSFPREDNLMTDIFRHYATSSKSCIESIKELLKGNPVTLAVTTNVSMSPFISISLKKDDHFNQQNIHAIYLDEDNNWFYRYMDFSNDEFKVENINESNNAGLYHFLSNHPELSDKKTLRKNLLWACEETDFRINLCNTFAAEKGLVHLDYKVWVFNSLYYTGYLTAIPLDKTNHQGKACFMIPNKELHDFYISELRLNQNDYPYIPRSLVIQKAKSACEKLYQSVMPLFNSRNGEEETCLSVTANYKPRG